MEAIWNDLNIDRVVAKTVAQALIESDIPAPLEREVSKVLHVEGDLKNSTARAQAGHVMVEGTVQVQILYMDAHDEPFGMRASAQYKHELALAGVEEGMQAQVTPQLQELNCTLENGRLRLTGVVELPVSVQQSARMRVLTGVNDVVGLQTLRADLPTAQLVPIAQATIHLREDLSNSNVQSIVLCSGSAQIRNLNFEDNGVEVEGTLSVSALTATDDGQLTPLLQHVSFSELIPMTQTLADNTGHFAKAQVVEIRLSPTSYDFGVIEMEAVVDITVYTIERGEIPALVDAYAPDCSFTCVQDTVERMLLSDATSKKHTMREAVSIPTGMPDAFRTVYAAARPVITGTSDDNGAMLVDGILFTSIVYQCDGGVLHSFVEDIPFQLALEVPYTPEAAVSADCLYTQASGGGRTLDVSFALEIGAELYEQSLTKIAVDAEPSTCEAQTSGILIYLSSAGERIWDVGKRFGLTLDQIHDWNPDLCDPLKEGQQLVLLSRVR